MKIKQCKCKRCTEAPIQMHLLHELIAVGELPDFLHDEHGIMKRVKQAIIDERDQCAFRQLRFKRLAEIHNHDRHEIYYCQLRLNRLEKTWNDPNLYFQEGLDPAQILQEAKELREDMAKMEARFERTKARYLDLQQFK